MPPILGNSENVRRHMFVKTKPTKVKVSVKEESSIFSETESDSEEEDKDTQKLDPDWRKTPLFKKIKSITVSNRTITSFHSLNSCR